MQLPTQRPVSSFPRDAFDRKALFVEKHITTRDGVRLRVRTSQRTMPRGATATSNGPDKVMLLAAPLGQCGPDIYAPIMARYSLQPRLLRARIRTRISPRNAPLQEAIKSQDQESDFFETSIPRPAPVAQVRTRVHVHYVGLSGFLRLLPRKPDDTEANLAVATPTCGQHTDPIP